MIRALGLAALRPRNSVKRLGLNGVARDDRRRSAAQGVRYRLVGTKAVETTGFDITGHYLDELLSAEPDQPWMDHYRRTYLTRKPLLGATTVPTSAGKLFTYEFGLFPLRNGGSTIEQFVAVEDYFGLSAKIVQVEPWREKSDRTV